MNGCLLYPIFMQFLPIEVHHDSFVYCSSFFFVFCFFLSFFLGPYLWHMGVPRLGAESELQQPTYAIATAMPDPSFICNLHQSSWQHRILNPLNEARDWTHNLMVPSWIRFCWATMGTPHFHFIYSFCSIFILFQPFLGYFVHRSKDILPDTGSNLRHNQYEKF